MHIVAIRKPVKNSRTGSTPDYHVIDSVTLTSYGHISFRVKSFINEQAKNDGFEQDMFIDGSVNGQTERGVDQLDTVYKLLIKEQEVIRDPEGNIMPAVDQGSVLAGGELVYEGVEDAPARTKK